MNEKVNEVSEEILDILIDLTRIVLGDSNHQLLLNDLQGEENKDGKQFVYKFATSLEKILGKNDAFATLRKVGISFAQKLMEIFPKEEWNDLFIDCLRRFGFAQQIIKNNDSALICNCVFYDILQENGLGPIEHPVCWTGWGLIEGFMKEFEGVDRIQWSSRDIENKRCKFDFIRLNQINFEDLK